MASAGGKIDRADYILHDSAPNMQIRGLFEPQLRGDAMIKLHMNISGDLSNIEKSRACVAGLEQHAVVAHEHKRAIGRGDNIMQVLGIARTMLRPRQIVQWIRRADQCAVVAHRHESAIGIMHAAEILIRNKSSAPENTVA